MWEFRVGIIGNISVPRHGTNAFVMRDSRTPKSSTTKLTHKWEYKVFVKIDEAGIRFALGHVGKVADEHATETHHRRQTNEEEEPTNE